MMQQVAERLGNVWQGTADLLYPRRCAVCRGEVSSGGGRYLCWDCLMGLPYIQDPYCRLCGDPVEGNVDHAYTCSWCLQYRPAFDRARSVVRYRGCVGGLLQDFKYQHATHLAYDLAVLLEACVRAHLMEGGLDAITYVPLHPLKARTRTYNQARLLGEQLARRMHLPLERNALRRVRWTATQTRLKAAARRANVLGAFETPMPDWIRGRRWLLVDDVMTTGATVDACARVLRQHGASRVVIATVARG